MLVGFSLLRGKEWTRTVSTYFERTASCLRKDEISSNKDSRIKHRKDDIGLIFDVGKGYGRDLHN